MPQIKGDGNHWFGIHQWQRLNKAGPLMTPAHIAIEPTNACNTKCPVCETGKDESVKNKGLVRQKKIRVTYR